MVENPAGLNVALRLALDVPPPGYQERAATALVPFRRAAVDAVVRDELLPRLAASPLGGAGDRARG